MFAIKIAGLTIGIKNKFDFVALVCKNYITDETDYDFEVCVSEEEFVQERFDSGADFSDGYIESVCIYRQIAQMLPKYDAFVIHCAAIEYEGNAYCFAAKSGTGKTTHIKLWRKTFGEKVHVINGDKPIMRFCDDKIYVCGTPWCGKENLNSNTAVPLKGICFLNQAPENKISALSSHESLGKLLKQVFIPKNKNDAIITIDLIGKMLSSVPMWSLDCTISEEAAKMSFESMSK